MTKTFIMVKLETDRPVTVNSTWSDQPPMISLDFPDQRVIGLLPRHSTFSHGVIQSITAQYSAPSGASSARFIQSLHIFLTAPYTYRVNSEAGRIVVEIEHPASVTRTAVEVGLRKGLLIGAAPAQELINERFRAMQEALVHATLPARQSQRASGEASAPAPIRQQAASLASAHIGRPIPAAAPTALKAATFPRMVALAGPRKPIRTTLPVAWWSLLASGIFATAAAGLWWLTRERVGTFLRRHAGKSSTPLRVPAGVAFVDEMVWKALAKRGYHLIIEVMMTEQPGGTIRVITKDGPPSALWCVGHGPVFEKQTVERFARAMREVHVTQGLLVGTGSFTVPAQRAAKAHHITLIGRDQLTELLGEGARDEHATNLLTQQRTRLEEIQGTLSQYAEELDVLRRQRNEASWHLGEERAKSASIESQLEGLTQRLRQAETELTGWQQDAVKLRKQWEESQWYLGEAQARGRYLQTQVEALQQDAQLAEEAEQQRREAQGALDEECRQRTTLETELADLQTRLALSADRIRALEDAVERLKQDIATSSARAERRTAGRMHVDDTTVELLQDGAEPIAIGRLRNLSRSGIGINTDSEVPTTSSPLRLRVRVPGLEPVEAAARFVWQQAEATGDGYQSGYALPESALTPSALDQLIEALLSSTSSNGSSAS
jgi:predicted  nucleic acid-binding Zn-ribbon protein